MSFFADIAALILNDLAPQFSYGGATWANSRGHTITGLYIWRGGASRFGAERVPSLGDGSLSQPPWTFVAPLGTNVRTGDTLTSAADSRVVFAVTGTISRDEGLLTALVEEQPYE